MPIAITGAKYAAATVSAVGTTTVTVGTTPFVSGDFASQRLVGLWGNSPTQLVTNPGFDTDTDWTKGAGVTISGGVANCSFAAAMLTQTVPLVVGKTYSISVSYTKSFGANLRLSNSLTDGVNAFLVTPLGDSGTITTTFVAVSPDGITIGADTAQFSGTIDNVTITEAAIFKGYAWARRYISTSQIELQTPFYDPATGVQAIQAIGDFILVSKNFAESVTAGLAVSNKAVTLTDSVTFGVAGNGAGVCFYDENKEITSNNVISFSGGLTVFGRMEDYATTRVSSPCDFFTTIGGTPFIVNIADTSAHAVWNGGTISGSGNLLYTGSSGTIPKTYIFNKVTNFRDFSTNSASLWGAQAARCQLVECTSIASSTNTIMVRWRNGVIRGGNYRVANNSAGPISVFGDDNAGTYSVSANANERIVVADLGSKAALVRSNGASALEFNFTNMITPDFRSTQGQATPLAANPNGVNRFYFSDRYTNLQSGTVGVVTLDADASVVDSTAASGASWSPSVFRRQYTGATQNFVRGPWSYGFKKYGFNPVSGAIKPSTYDLGPVGMADNVSFGGVVNQLADAAVTLSQAAASALTSIATLDNLYDAAINWGTLSVANAQYPSLGAFPVTANGMVLDLGSRNLVIDATAASAFAVNTGTNTITIKATVLAEGAKFTSLTTSGTITFSNGASSSVIYTSSGGTSAQLNLIVVPLGSRIIVIDDGGDVVDYVASSSASYTLNIPPGSMGIWKWVVKSPGYEHAKGTFMPSVDSRTTVSPTLIKKLNTDGSDMYQGTTSPLVTVSFSAMTTAYIDIGNGTAPLQATFDESEDALCTLSGMEWLALNRDDLSQFNSAGGDFLFLTSGWRLRRASPSDANATIQAFVQSVDGAPVDETNGPVRFLASDSPTAIAAAVRAELATELSRLDIAVSSRLAATSYTDPDNEGITAIKEKTATLENAPTAVENATATRTELAAELARIDVATSTRLAASAYVEPLDATETQAAAAAALAAYGPVVAADLAGLATAAGLTDAAVAILDEVDAIPTNPLLATDARLDSLDAKVSSRLAATSYTDPDNEGITAIREKTDTLVNGPTLADIEASTVLAKEATVESRASKADAAVINDGVQKASLLIPHTTPLPA